MRWDALWARAEARDFGSLRLPARGDAALWGGPPANGPHLRQHNVILAYHLHLGAVGHRLSVDREESVEVEDEGVDFRPPLDG